jgi:hypothetical protein
MGPVSDDGVEDGADVGVDANFCVKGVDEGADLGLGDLFGGHGETPWAKFEFIAALILAS